MKRLEYYLDLPYSVTLSPERDAGYMATIPDLPNCLARGSSPEEALKALSEEKKNWLWKRLRNGESIPEPADKDTLLPSGKWVQRVPRTLHKRLATLAEKEGVSLNQLVTSIIAEAVGVRDHIRPISSGKSYTARQVWSLISNWTEAHQALHVHSQHPKVNVWLHSQGTPPSSPPFVQMIHHILSLGPQKNDVLTIRENNADRIEEARHPIKGYLRRLPS